MPTHVPQAEPEPRGPSSSPSNLRHPTASPPGTWRGHVLPRSSGSFVRAGSEDLLGFGGEGVRVSRPGGGPGEAARLTPQGFPIWTSGRGDVPSAEAAAQRRWGFAPGGPVVPSFLPAVGGRRVGGPAG